MNLLFVINPAAGKGRTQDAIPVIEKYCSVHGHACEIRTTSFPGEATTITREGLHSKPSIVIAVGGDGTILEVANGLVGTHISLGIIPLGSGNDFARDLGIPVGFEQIPFALQIITNNEPRPVDVGSFHQRFFLNVASVGFDAEIIRDLYHVKKIIKGKAAYLLSVFLKFLTYRPKQATLVIDGVKIDTSLFLTAVCNGTCYGGGMKVNPLGSNADGFFDIILIHPIPRYKIPFLLTRFMKGQHLQLPYVQTYRCKEIQIFSHEKLVVNVDGECAATTPITFRIMPLSIHVISAK